MREWPRVKLGEIAPICRRPIQVDLEGAYPELGVRSFGKGTFHKPPLSGADAGNKRLFGIESGDLVFSNVFAWEGAVAVAKPEDSGRFGSHRFITCVVDRNRADPKFLCSYLTASNEGLEQLRLASPGGAGRNRTLGIEKLAEISVPVPPLSEQRAIVARLDALADKTGQLTTRLDAIETDADHLLALRFRDAIIGAPKRAMADVAPLVRRGVAIDLEASYTELGVRSFYKGTFQRRTVSGSEFTWQKLFRVEANDLIFSNIMAWEQAIALAKPEDHGCVGNHRMLTCVADPDQAFPAFLAYYFTTEEGFGKVYAASPGTAARNRTLVASSLESIQVPLPPLAVQQAFVTLQGAIVALKARHTAIRAANACLLPTTLERLFNGTAKGAADRTDAQVRQGLD